MFVQRDGVRLFYDRQGAGEPPVVLVHGWTMSHEIWREQRAPLAQRNTTVAVDLRGFGRSDKPDGDYALPVFVDDLHFTLRQLALERPVLVGWSLGASICLQYAAEYPNELSKLALIDGSPLLMARPDFPHAIAAEAVEQIMLALQQDYAAGTRAFIETMFPERVDEQLKAWIHGITRQTGLRVAVNSIENSAAADLRACLAEVSVPTLIMCGKQDRVCLPAASRYMHAHIADSELYEFPGKGHAPFLTASREFNARLLAFIDSA